MPAIAKFGTALRPFVVWIDIVQTVSLFLHKVQAF